MTRVAIYARYSSDNQRDTSIEDQVRICREHAERMRWEIANIYTDHAISGASMIRPGIQQMMQDIIGGRVDIVLSEALDRLSRDQEDISGFYKRAQFAGVALHTLSEGEITALHIGFKGTMNALFLTDLKDKVKRGQRGRVENGKIGGGNCYGYDVVRRLDDRGEPVRGERTINQEQARIVERIFREYANGRSPKAIARQLNLENVAAPTESDWGPSTIYGNWQRGAGILNNAQYIGQIVYNKVSYPKNPDTGRHVTRINPEAKWVRKEVPELRIVDQELWERVKARQLSTRKSVKKFWQHQRPRYLFSYLLKCGCCGGGVSKISTTSYGCSTARNKGKARCTNHHTLRQDELERTVLNILQSHLMQPELVEVFCKEYTARINQLRKEHNATIAGYKAELEKIRKTEQRIVKAVSEGWQTPAMKDVLLGGDKRRQQLEALLLNEKPAPVILHPNMADRYQREVSALIRTFHETSHREEAIELLRGLIDKIVLTPTPGKRGMVVNLYGDLAGILNMAMGGIDSQADQELDLKQVKLVVGLDEPTSTRRRQGKRVSSTQVASVLLQEKLVGPEGLEPPTKRL
jgi:site-specific DNA recombinase